MTRTAQIELRDLELPIKLGTYGPQDVVPDAHILDLTLTVAPDLVHIVADKMALVFDYDPLIADIFEIAQSQHYETQEYLMSQIASACARYAEICGIDIILRKRPVRNGTGSLGVRLMLGAKDLSDLR